MLAISLTGFVLGTLSSMFEVPDRSTPELAGMADAKVVIYALIGYLVAWLIQRSGK
jgi:hypothetical protein